MITTLPAAGQECRASEPGCELYTPTIANNFVAKPVAEIAGFEITNLMVVTGFSLVVLTLFFFAAFRAPKLIPGRIQSLGEMGVTFVRDQILRPNLGTSGDRFLPFLVSLFFFIWVMNVWGIVPGVQVTPNFSIGYTAALAIIVWVVYMYLGMAHQGPIRFFTNMMFPPGVPIPVYFLLAPIELLSNVLVRPFTLAVRLFANMFAGHALLLIFGGAAWYLSTLNLMGLVGGASFVMLVIMTMFEMGIHAIQAYIFTTLTASYIAGSISDGHH